jgi:hypothetical protein
MAWMPAYIAVNNLLSTISMGMTGFKFWRADGVERELYAGAGPEIFFPRLRV